MSDIKDAAKERKFACACSGCIGPGAMCGYIIVSSKLCGAPDEYDCEHKVIRITGVNDQGE
jgi:hypothetical protein